MIKQKKKARVTSLNVSLYTDDTYIFEKRSE